MLLEIKDLWIHYGRGEALRGISIGVEEGSIVTLIGANGDAESAARDGYVTEADLGGSLEQAPSKISHELFR
jgi:ABC-type histidine transport system ATPase subunit